jgi:hypothetical protein
MRQQTRGRWSRREPTVPKAVRFTRYGGPEVLEIADFAYRDVATRHGSGKRVLAVRPFERTTR